MSKNTFLDLITYLKEYFTSSSNEEKIELFIEKALGQNPWFTRDLVDYSMDAIQKQFFDRNKWEHFFEEQGLPKQSPPKKVGIVLPGNLPAIGMHDVLMVLASGNICLIKLSSQDTPLMQLYVEVIQTFGKFEIQIVDKIKDSEFVIATGSDTTGNYFDQYFKDIPRIIRKNRSSLAILWGNESKSDFEGLAKDIFTYYGLGCRNVSSIFIPKDYDLIPLFDVLTTYQWVMEHHKYSNNYQYQKTLFLLNQVPHFDLGNLLVLEKPELVSAVGVLHLHYYSNEQELKEMLVGFEEKIQCKVGNGQDLIPFGLAQEPSLSDWADGVNTYRIMNYEL